MYEKTVKDDNITLNQEIDDIPAPIEDYVERWRVRIWDHGFTAMFKGKDAFSKTKAFKETKNTDLAVRRVLYRYDLIF